MGNSGFKQHESLIRIIKKNELTRSKSVVLRIGAFLLSLVAGGIFLAALGANPLDAYALIIKGAFVGSKKFPLSSIQATANLAIPLLISSLGLAFAFRMKFWNIGAEGQIMMGAIFATFFALNFENMPKTPLIILMTLAGIVGGGLWAVIPALFKVKFNTNETLFTLMFNYIALYTIQYMSEGPWKDPSQTAFSTIKRFTKTAWLPSLGGVHIGWLFAVALVFAVYIYLYRSKQGYEISVVGESQATARYAGMNVNWIIIRTMFISGAVCGLAGMLQATGSDHTLSTGVAGGTGFTAITVAWLGQLNPFVITIISILFSILEKGSAVMQSSIKISSNASEVLQAVILFFVLGCEFFIRYRFVFRKKEAKV